MQYTLLFTAAVLAGSCAALPEPHNHGRLHENRDVVTDVEVDVVTEVDVEYTTVTGDGPGGDQQWAAPTQTEAAWSSQPPAPAPPAPTSTTEASAPAYTPPAYTPTTLATSYSSPTEAPAPSSPSTTASAASSSSGSSSSGISSSNLTPNGKKRGLSGYVGIQNKAAFSELAPYISWYSDYTANTPTSQGVEGVGMLWGANGSPCGDFEVERLSTFNSMISGGTVPSIMFGFYEPDCTCTMSSDMSVSDAATQWDSLIVPLKSKGTVLGSPSMCKQKDEDFLTPFKSQVSQGWDVTSVHINKPNVTEVQKVVEYYVQKYNKPVWVSEFACVNDEPSWSPCTDQTQVNSLINDAVKYFEGEPNVVAYGPSNGEGLGDVWPLTTNDGQLTTSGQTYLNAIKAL